ncbi:MAG TPA: DNA polymerase III subunit beta [Actinobacteria bacterium]|nr:DNA polymerase III subunit beta [Actinomycetota bacterium]
MIFITIIFSIYIIKLRGVYMFIKCTQSDLWNTIQIVQKAVSTRSTLPILSGILFQGKGQEVILNATNLELSIKTSIPADIKKEGSVVIPARLIGEVVKNLPDSTIEMFLDEPNGLVRISCQESNFNIKILPPEDFPKFPELKIEQSCIINAEELIDIVKQVVKATSTDETRPILTGVLLSVNKNKIKMVATDSYRLAIKEVDLKKGIKDKIKVIVPSKTLVELMKIIPKESKDVSMCFTENQLIFKTGKTILISRLIEGQYPNYQQLLPDSYEIKIEVNKEELIAAVRRASLFTQDNSPIKIKIRDEMMELNAAAIDVGEAVERVKIKGGKEDIEIAFNSQYLLEGLMSMDEENVIFEIIDTVRPGVIKPKKKQNYLYLIMPVRIV